ncbi:MAG: hypothetical protein OXF56_22790 [Rhodobacteraceae bacterium]|nr:hypothetical protein [Paracoccaceae bacterium]
MSSDNALAPILASIHEAMLDDARWPATSALIDEACGIGGNGLVVGERFCGDDRIYFARFLYRGESRPDLAREYFDAYFPHDTGIRRLMNRPEGRLVHLPDLFTEDELKSSPVYNEGWCRLGGQNSQNVHFDDPDGLRLVWSIADPIGNGCWESAQLRLIEQLLPHVRQFVRVRQALAAADSQGAGLEGLLDNDRIGVVQLDRGGQVLAANAPALDILRHGDGLLDRDGVLEAMLPADRNRLRRLLGRALPKLWGEVPCGGSITVQRLSERSRLALHVSPVGTGAPDFGGRRVAALVLVVDPARRPRIDPTRVKEVLGLTPSEGRVAALLAEGRPVAEIAASTGWRVGYVRRLLKRIYKKQGVSGQVALVSLGLALDRLPRD